MTKKVILSIGLGLVIGIIGAVCQNGRMAHENSINGYAQAEIEYKEFEDVLDDADVICEAEVLEIDENTNFARYLIEINSVYKGECIPEKIWITNYYYNYGYEHDGVIYAGVTNTGYIEGETYVFVLQHIENVYEEKYLILANTYIPIDSETASYFCEEIEAKDSALDLIVSGNFDERGAGDELSIPYIQSNDRQEILSHSQYIVSVSLLGVVRETEVAEVYECYVNDVIKGNINTTEDNLILIPFFKNTVETGGTYVVALNSDTESSLIYCLSSRDSLFGTYEIESIVEALQ